MVMVTAFEWFIEGKAFSFISVNFIHTLPLQGLLKLLNGQFSFNLYVRDVLGII